MKINFLKINPQLHAPLRALCAILIGLVIYHFDHSTFRLWILLTIVILLPTTTGATWQKAISRVVGTVFGVLFGFLLFVVIGDKWYLYAILILSSLFLTAYLSKINYTACMFFAGILVVLALGYFLAKGSMDTAWTFVFARLFDTVIGAMIVILVALFFWPERSSDKLKETAGKAIRALIENFTLQFKIYSGKLNYEVDNKSINEFYQSYTAFIDIHLEMKLQPKKLLQYQLNVSAIANNLLAAFNSLVALHVNYPLISEIPALKKQVSEKLEPFYLHFQEIENYCTETNDETSVLGKLNQLIEEYLQLIAGLRESLSENKMGVGVFEDTSLSTLLINIRDIFIALEFSLVAYKQLLTEL